MRVLCSFVLCWSVVVLPGVRAEGKKPASNAEKIVGTWKGTKGEVAGSTIEFTKDGKLTIQFKEAGMTYKIPGTYKLDGDKLTITKEGTSGPAKIKKLTDKELTLEIEKDQLAEFTKVK